MSARGTAGRCDEIRLVVQADDFGMCHAVNSGVVRAFRHGLVSQSMLMAPCPWFDEASGLAKAHSIPVGVHSTLTCEWDSMRWRPLTGGASLVESDGTFHRSVESAVPRVEARQATAELFAQARRLAARGLTPIALDVHMGMICEEAYRAVCHSLGLPFLYPVFEPHLVFDSFEVLSPRPTRQKRAWLLDYLDALRPGTHFLQTHPGVAGAELASLALPGAPNEPWASAYRVSDLAVLTDPEVLRTASARGIRTLPVSEL